MTAKHSQQGADQTSVFQKGDAVDHFKIVRLVGRGGMGAVYLARDTKLGRKVALKVVHPELLGTEESLDRFFFEARATARFNHPHIVTIFAVGEHRGSPYLALEYLAGQTLRTRMSQDRPGIRESARIGLAIASALQEAHRHDILHRDLKPENVLIPRDGRLRVLDFGLAKSLQTDPLERRALAETLTPGSTGELLLSEFDEYQTAGHGLKGTPLYMAPEQWQGKPMAKTTDIWALGAILYELITGISPFAGATQSEVAANACSAKIKPPDTIFDEVPAVISQLICGCLEKEASERPSAKQVSRLLSRFLAGGRGRQVEEQNAFLGLLPYSEAHSDVFFGRDSETSAFLERLREQPVLPVVGPSGAGKSSFVHAGVVPRLREQGPWLVFNLRPGSRPFQTLAGSLLGGEVSTMRRRSASLWSGAQGDQPAGDSRTRSKSGAHRGRADSGEHRTRAEEKLALAQQLEQSPGLLSLMLQNVAEVEEARVLLFVDQLEEVYTLVDDEARRRAFTDAVCSAADDPLGPVRVVFTLRDDFIGRMAEGPVAREVLGHVTVLRSPEAPALEEILVKSAEAAGYRYDDPALVGEMIAEVRGEAACLPLLQFATQMLWQQRDTERRVLRRADYEAMGGVSGALARHADTVLEGLSAAEVRLARELFLRLVTAEGTKQILPRAQLLEGLPAEAKGILRRLVAAKAILVRKARHGAHDEGELELVHDSLINVWDQLARWIDESREELTFLAEVGQSAELWQRRGSLDQEVWGGDALRDALRTLERCSTKVPDSVRRFLEAGRAKEQRLQRGRRRRLAVVIGALSLVALIAAALAVIFADQEREVRRQKDQAEAKGAVARLRLAEAHREGARAALARGNLLEARAKLRSAMEIEVTPAARAMWWRMSRTPLFWKKKLEAKILGVAFSPDGKTVAAACQDKTVYLFNVDTAELRTLRGHEDQVFSVSFSVDGRKLATGDLSGQVRLWNLASRTVRKLDGHNRAVLHLAFSPDGKSLATAGLDPEVRLWKVTTGALVQQIKVGRGGVRSVAFHPKGTSLATAGLDAKVHIWDLANGKELHALTGHKGAVTALAYSPDGLRLASGSHDQTIRLWDPTSGSQRRLLRGHSGRISGVLFSPAGDRLVSSAWDSTIRFWRLPGGTLERSLLQHQSPVNSVGLDRSGALLASGSWNGTVRIWNIAREIPRGATAGHRSGVNAVCISPQGRQIASVGEDKSVRLWDRASAQSTTVSTGHTKALKAAAYSPDGKLLATAGLDGTIRVLNASSGAELHNLTGHTAGIFDLAFSPDGALLASGSRDRTVRLWDLASGKQRRRFEGHTAAISAVAYSPGGRYVASGGTGYAIWIWDTTTGKGKRLPDKHKGMVYGLSYAPDGKRLASSSWDGTIRIWEPQTGSSRVLGKIPGRIHRVAFAPDGARLGSTSSDGIARVWQLQSGKHAQLRGHRSEVNTLSFSADGQLVATGGDDGTVRLWHASTGRPYWRAPALLPSSTLMLSHHGWQNLGGAGAPKMTAARRAMEQQALLVTESAGGDTVCLMTHDQHVEAWDTRAGKRIYREHLPGLQQVLAIKDGCVTRSISAAGVQRRGHEFKDLVASATAIASDGDRVLVAVGREVLTFDRSGKRVASRAADIGVSAILSVKHWLVLGFREGTIELLPMNPKKRKPAYAFEGVPSSAVTRIIEGPVGTLIVGFASGLVGIWGLENGSSLDHTRLHGSVVHLVMKADRLYAATDLGDHVVWDLGVFKRSQCQLLKEVWQQVPVVWEGGLPVIRGRAKNHKCVP